jgi:Zinc dependent phospholipase C
MGYYPLGNKDFSDLTHYVRSGDFVVNLLSEASDLDEYAFALGALAHYSADNCGHPTINQVVAIEFPKLQEKFGKEVTYANNPKAHIRTEFGFDVTQVAKNRYTSDRYHDFIGFEISKPVLERAFLKTYGLRLSDVISGEDLLRLSAHSFFQRGEGGSALVVVREVGDVLEQNDLQRTCEVGRLGAAVELFQLLHDRGQWARWRHGSMESGLPKPITSS